MASQPQPRINRIVFIDLNGQVSTIAPNGQDSRVLTPAGNFFQFPAWSPDGAYLAAIGSDGAGAGIFILTDQFTPNPRPLYYSTGQTPFYLYWSPDSRRVSFIANHPRGGIGLHIAPVDGQSYLLTTGQPCFWDWTPGSDLILIHTGGRGVNARLAFVDPGRKGYEEEIARPGLFQAPGIALNGRFWAFSAKDMFDNTQLVVESDAGQRQTVSHEGALALSWSPTGNQLAFTSPPVAIQRFYGPLRLLDAASGQVRLLADDMALAFFWSPDGQTIAYFTLAETWEEDSVDGAESSVENNGNDFSTNGRTPSVTNSEWLQSERLLLDLWLVDINSGRQRRLISFEPSPLFVNQFLPFFDQYALSHRLWSPDSKALVLPIIDEERMQIMVVSVDGQPPEPVAEGVMAFWSQQ